MSNLRKTIKTFTPREYRNLSVSQINRMMDNNIPFKVSNLFKLVEGFSFCTGTHTLYLNEDEVELTNLETKLLALLVSRAGEIVPVSEIKEAVWKDREMSIYTLRNVVNKLRNKSCYEIVKNTSSHGYSIQGK